MAREFEEALINPSGLGLLPSDDCGVEVDKTQIDPNASAEPDTAGLDHEFFVLRESSLLIFSRNHGQAQGASSICFCNRGSRKTPRHSVTAPITQGTRICVELNASDSPLLRLSEDIRRMIWREVSGGARSVHIYNQEHAIRNVGFDGHHDLIKSGNSPLRPGINHFLCLASRSDQYTTMSPGDTATN